MDVDWLERELDEVDTCPADTFQVSQKVKDEFRSIIPYWKDKGIRKVLFNSLPTETRKIRLEAKVFTVSAHEETALGHVILDYPKVLNQGLEGIIHEIQDKMDALVLHGQKDAERLIFYQAALTACEAAITFAQRYAYEAERLSETEPDRKRKSELVWMAQVCRRVLAKPARTFWEALQSLWFVQFIPQIENNGSSYSPARMDQYLYPFYQQEIKAVSLT